MANNVPVVEKDSTNLQTIVNLLRQNQKQNQEQNNEIKATLLFLTAFILNKEIENSVDKFSKQNKDQNKQILDKIKELYEQRKQLTDSLKLNK